MNGKVITFLFLMLLITSKAFSRGVSFQAAVGYPEAQIINPDETKALYSGVGLLGRFSLPVWEGKAFGTRFNLSGRYLDLNNNANSSTQRETGNHIGPGAGLSFNFYRLFLGADYWLIKARHFWVGEVNHYQEYEYNLLTYYGGLNFEFSNTLSIGLVYTHSQTTIPGEQLDLEGELKYSDSTLWLKFVYSTGDSFGKFLSHLFN